MNRTIAAGSVFAVFASLALSCGGGGGATSSDTTPPSIPTGVSATVLSTTSIRVTWVASTDNNQVSGYMLHRGGASYHDCQEPHYDDTGLTPGTTYCYTVLAYDKDGNNSAQSPQACATTPTSGFVLNIVMGGTGGGTVTSSLPGLNCGTDCNESYASGTSVSLTATAASGSTFAGWSGCDAPSGPICTMSMTANKTVTATFNAPVTNYTLAVSKSGTGSGSVTSSPPGVNCGTDCSESYASGTSVSLTATAASGSTFAGWSGCDAPSGPICSMSMTANKTVSATFTSTTPDYELGTLPATSTTGTYTVTWTCIGAICSTTTTLQEAPNTSFTSPQNYTFENNARTKTFTGKADGAYCYRVAAFGYTNWSTPKCIAVAIPANQTITLQPVANNAVIYESLDSSTANTVFQNWYPSVGINSFWNFLGGASQGFASLVRFDVSALSGKTIDSATFALEARSAPVGYYHENFKIAAIATSWSATTVTWTAMESFLYYTASWQSFTHPAYSGQKYNINLQSTVQAWATGTFPNNGLAIMSTDYSWPGNVDSLDAYDFWVPTLTVTYH